MTRPLRDINFADYIASFNDLTAVNAANIRARSSGIANRLITLIDNGSTSFDVPTTPTGLVLADTGLTLDLKWTADDTGALFPIERAVYDTSAPLVWERIANVQGRSYSDADIEVDVVYAYRVYAISEAGVLSPASAVVSGKASGGVSSGPDLIANPTIDDVTTIDVDLSWDAFTGDTVAARLQKRRGTNGPWVTVGDMTTTSFTDVLVLEGDTYYYRIAGVDTAGVVSAYTDFTPAFATIPYSDTTPPAVPGNVQATAGDAQIIVTWSAVPDPDTSYYEIGYAATPTGGSYTPAGTVLFGDPLTFTVAGLTNGTEYGVAVRAVDGAGNESAWSTEATATPAAEADLIPPAAPTGLEAESFTVNYVTLAWNHNTETDVALYRIYGRRTGTNAWIALDTTTVGTTSIVINMLANLNFDFYITAEDTSGNESDPSAIVVQRTDGSSFDPGTGGGGSGDINGDTDLPTGYRAPGYFFDYVVDLSGYTDDSVAMLAIALGAIQADVQAGVIDMSISPTIAVIMPTRPNDRAVKFQRSPSWTGSRQADSAIIPSGWDCDIHFIGPWVGGVDKTTAMQNCFNDSGATYSYVLDTSGPTGANLSETGDHIASADRPAFCFRTAEDVDLPGEFHFWCMNWKGWGWDNVAAFCQSGASNTQTMREFHFHCMKFDQDGVTFPEGGSPNWIQPGFWGFSGYNTLYNFHGVYADTPYTIEHMVYMRSVPANTDCTWEWTNFYRYGGQALQITSRTSEPQHPGDPNGPEGILTFSNFRTEHPGRNEKRAASFITAYTPLMKIVIEDSVFLHVDTESTEVHPEFWPNATQLAIPFETYGGILETVGGVTFTNINNPVFNSQGHGNFALEMRRTIMYSTAPAKSLIKCEAVRDVVLEDCLLATGPVIGVDPGEGSSQTRFNFCASSSSPAPNPVTTVFVESASVSNVNSPERIAWALAAEPSIGSIAVPDYYFGSEQNNVGSTDRNMRFTNMRYAPYSPGTNPDLIEFSPAVPDTPSASNITANSVDITFNTPAGSTSRVVGYSTTAGGPYTEIAGAVSPQTVGSLSGATQYYFAVKALNGGNSSPADVGNWSTEITATTL